jgi:hypothetical protein
MCLSGLKVSTEKHHGRTENGKSLYKSRHDLFYINTVPLRGRKIPTKKKSTSSNALKVKSDNLYTDVKGGENPFDLLLQTETFPSGF